MFIFKLLGGIFISDLKWYENTQLICKKGYERLWMLRRLKKLGAIISLTNYFSKQFEHFVIIWLLKYVGSHKPSAHHKILLKAFERPGKFFSFARGHP